MRMVRTTEYLSALLLCFLSSVGCVSVVPDLPHLLPPQNSNSSKDFSSSLIVTPADPEVDPMSKWFSRVTQDGIDPFPSVCSLHNSDGRLIGSGVLIRPNVVLTAGHCIDNGISSVRFIDDEEIAVKRVVLYPHYSETLGWNTQMTDDIGMVFLEYDYDCATPAVIGDIKTTKRYHPITSVGYSFGYKKYSKRGTFRYFGTLIEQPKKMTFLPDPVSIWFGDSGGGVFANIRGEMCLVGIISSFTKSHTGRIMECTATITSEYSYWIDLEIDENEEEME